MLVALAASTLANPSKYVLITVEGIFILNEQLKQLFDSCLFS
jgi:hypothetical protein